MEETKIDFQDGKVILQSRDGQICFQAISPQMLLYRGSENEFPIEMDMRILHILNLTRM